MIFAFVNVNDYDKCIIELFLGEYNVFKEPVFKGYINRGFSFQ
ncbi:hypothetical protein CPS_0782 [Colwellia psychrerythraea 34H]|uniref:Uncharacterized protein n=1 Tax=Colwellia psychrerythraea (strain 34H / ATCC BAA-681) TaxID=167879 RepID=Q488I3_COLP3|nr:hypothetical protein CPS_0782 [Colwellia psychrerythraea 34H]